MKTFLSFQEEEQSKPKAWRRINRFSNFLVTFKDNLATEKQISDTKSYKHCSFVRKVKTKNTSSMIYNLKRLKLGM